MSDSGDETPVIDWEEAREQCGDDEELLNELLAELYSESKNHYTKLLEAQKEEDNAGSAANLMVKRLSAAAMEVEMASRGSSKIVSPKLIENLGTQLELYREFLEKKGLLPAEES